MRLFYGHYLESLPVVAWRFDKTLPSVIKKQSRIPNIPLGRGVCIVRRVAKLIIFVGIMYVTTSVLYYLSTI